MKTTLNAPTKRQRVLLYGTSLILDTASVSLRQYPNLEITSISPTLATVNELSALAPDVIIFEVNGVRPEAALALLETRPTLVLIGVDPSSDQMLVWSGKQARALTTQDLVAAIMTVPDSRLSTLPAFAQAQARGESFWHRFTLTRRQKLAFACASIAASVGLLLIVADTNAPLIGTAVSNSNETIGWLTCGVLLGIVLIALLLWQKKR